MLTGGAKRSQSASGDTKNLRTLIEASTEPIVGCNQVIEYVADSPGVDARYSCTLCDVVAPSAGHMLTHLISTKHRNAYIDRFEGRSGNMPTRTADSTRHICTLIETRMGRMVHAMRTITGDQAFPADIARGQATKRAKAELDSGGKGSRNVTSTTSSQSQGSAELSDTVGLAVSEGPLGELLKQLSKCVVKNESDASMALYVSRALLGSLLDYRSRQQPEQSALLKDMLRTMGGMLRTMANAVDGTNTNNNNNSGGTSNITTSASQQVVSSNTTQTSVESTNSAVAPPQPPPPQQPQQQYDMYGVNAASSQPSMMVGGVMDPSSQMMPTAAVPNAVCGNIFNNGVMPATAAPPNQYMMTPPNMMATPNAMMGAPNQMMNGNPMMAGSSMMTAPGMMAGPNPMMGGPNPMMGGPNPMMCGPNPMMGGPNPMMGGPNPMMGGPNPMMGGPNPMMGGPNPMMGGPNPMMGGPNPMMGGPMMGGPNPMMGGPNMNGMGPMNDGSMGNCQNGPGHPNDFGPCRPMGGPRGPRPHGPGGGGGRWSGGGKKEQNRKGDADK